MIQLAIPSDWAAIINAEADSALTNVMPNISVLVAELASMLKVNINVLKNYNLISVILKEKNSPD